jgi:hypothetical protein
LVKSINLKEGTRLQLQRHFYQTAPICCLRQIVHIRPIQKGRHLSYNQAVCVMDDDDVTLATLRAVWSWQQRDESRLLSTQPSGVQVLAELQLGDHHHHLPPVVSQPVQTLQHLATIHN